MNFTEKIFTLLSENLKLPYYQAERRIDIFINVFLEDIVRKYSPFKDAIYLLSEFPLKKTEVSDHAAHIDYLMFSPSKQTVLLVELKTDERSVNVNQLKFYESEPRFCEWYTKFEKIKMKGFDSKKNIVKKLLKERLGDDLTQYSCALIIIKPDGPTESDKKEGRYFIALNEVDIDTEYADEWRLFREIILSNLSK
ncbi:MAG TPA: hypothetical protein DIT07_08385 [Sphingobacteriaceae bacterium]|nr:hypothetical protein [Sphingobacteriaceae bacterium]